MPIKILHLSTALSWRGGEQQIAYLMESLATSDAFQQWIVCTAGGQMAQYCQENNYTYFPVKKRFSLDPLFARRLKQYCEELKIQLLHVHDAHAHNIAILAADLWRNKIPIIVARRVDFPPKQSFFSHYKYNHPKVARIICVSNTIKHLMEPCVQKKARLQTIYSGIDIAKFQTSNQSNRLRTQYKISSEIPLIGLVAALAPHKDIYTFVRTAHQLIQEQVKARFIIIGAGKEKEKILALINNLQLQSCITLTGFRNDVPSILPELDIFLMTSSSEGLGTSILDAFAAKVPVVATRAGGIIEMVVHEKTGLLASIKDHEGLAKQVKRLLDDSMLRKELIMEATKRVVDFSKETMGKQTIQVYQEIISMMK